METGLSGRSALVSGGSKGIGKGIARALAREGVSVALLTRTEHEVLAAAHEIAGETGVTVVGVQADVTDTNSLKAAVAHVSGFASFNALNIVVNNAAPPITRADRQIQWTDKEWLAAIDVKTVGALRLIHDFEGSGIAHTRSLFLWNFPCYCDYGIACDRAILISTTT